MNIILPLFIGTGVLLAGLSIPLILERIPPNGLYGFRVRKTMEHPEIWYPVNKYGGWRLLVAGLAQAAAAVGIALVPNITLDAYALSVLFVWVVAFTIAMISTVRYMNSL